MYKPSSFRDQLQNSKNPSWRDDLSGELYHHGIKGQKWGVRRYQNPDGSLTSAGKKRQKQLLRGAEVHKRVANKYRNAADEYEKHAKEHPITGVTYQIIADNSRAIARQSDREAKKMSAKATFDKNRIRKANKEYRIDAMKDVIAGPVTRETYKRNRKAGKSRVNSVLKGLAANAVSTYAYPDVNYTYKKK